jgi:hypothetical protein
VRGENHSVESAPRHTLGHIQGNDRSLCLYLISFQCALLCLPDQQANATSANVQIQYDEFADTARVTSSVLDHLVEADVMLESSRHFSREKAWFYLKTFYH